MDHYARYITIFCGIFHLFMCHLRFTETQITVELNIFLVTPTALIR